MVKAKLFPTSYNRSKYFSKAEEKIHKIFSEGLQGFVRDVPKNKHYVYVYAGPYIKKMGTDIDFVIVDNYRGIFYIEVKGSAYSGKDGKNYQRSKRINESSKKGAINYLSTSLESELRRNNIHSLSNVLREHRALIRTGTDKSQNDNSDWDFVWGAKDAENLLTRIDENIAMNEREGRGLDPHIYKKPFNIICDYLESLVAENPDIVHTDIVPRTGKEARLRVIPCADSLAQFGSITLRTIIWAALCLLTIPYPFTVFNNMDMAWLGAFYSGSIATMLGYMLWKWGRKA